MIIGPDLLFIAVEVVADIDSLGKHQNLDQTAEALSDFRESLRIDFDEVAAFLIVLGQM